MAKNATHRIRTGLPADREKQPTFSKRAKRQIFGIGRPLTAESNEQLLRVMAAAQPDIEKHLKDIRASSRIADLITRQEFGVMFLVEGRVRNAMRFGLLESGFALGRMIEGVEQHSKDDVSLQVPLDGCGWFDKDRDRSMVARLGASDGLQELYDEVPIVEALLELSRATGLELSVPDKVTLFDYGATGDGKGLSRGQRMQVRGIVQEHFEQAGIESLALGGLALGNSNSHPWMVA